MTEILQVRIWDENATSPGKRCYREGTNEAATLHDGTPAELLELLEVWARRDKAMPKDVVNTFNRRCARTLIKALDGYIDIPKAIYNEYFDDDE